MSDTTATIDRYPTTWTQAKRDLRCPRGSRTVWLSSRAMPRQHSAGLVYDVTGPSGDDVLTVQVWSGMLPLRVLAGNVVVVLGSPWGNVVEVSEAARESTTIAVAQGCKATLYGADPALVNGSARTILFDGAR